MHASFLLGYIDALLTLPRSSERERQIDRQRERKRKRATDLSFSVRYCFFGVRAGTRCRLGLGPLGIVLVCPNLVLPYLRTNFVESLDLVNRELILGTLLKFETTGCYFPPLLTFGREVCNVPLTGSCVRYKQSPHRRSVGVETDKLSSTAVSNEIC